MTRMALMTLALPVALLGAVWVGPAMAQSSPGATGASCVVSKWAWTSGVRENANVDVLEGGHKGKDVYFWMTVKGDAAALEIVKANKGIPVAFSWGYYAGSVFIRDKVRWVDLTDKEISGLENELAGSGFWDFRIWDFREKSAYWVVKALDPSAKCVAFSPARDGCAFTICFQAVK